MKPKRKASVVLGIVLLAPTFLRIMPQRRTEKVLTEFGKAHTAVVKAAMGPPRPPLTRWQRFAAWFRRNITEPLAGALATALTVVAIAWAAHIGWELYR